MKNTLIALAMALALCGCASTGTTGTDAGEATTASQKVKTKRVCTTVEEASTGSRLSKRTCRKVPVTDSAESN